MSEKTRARSLEAALALVFLLCAAQALSAVPPHIALAVDLDPAERRLAIVAELASPGEFLFALHPSLQIRAASADGRPVAVALSRDGRRVWRVAAPKGARLRIDYDGTLPELDTKLDHRAVLQAMPPMASARGSFLPAGSGWYPTLPELFTYSVKLSLPAGQRGLVAGTLVSETLPASVSDHYLAQFDFAQPAAGIDLMAGPYMVREKLVAREAAAPLRVRTYFYGDLTALADGYLEDGARYIELYSREIGAYPYDAFSVVASPLPTGFGMPTLTYLGAQVLRLPFIRATSLGHEVLHNWWGNGVYVDYAKGNWSEGLTTFMADYFYKERESADAAREARLAWLRDFAAAAQSAQMPLTAFRSRTHSAEAAVGYGKSAMLFVMLRDEIGAEAFRKGLRAFWDSRKFKVATWDDLRAAFEESGGRSLKTFFDQWVDRGGGPAISVTDARAKSAGGKTLLSLTVVQSKPAYVLELPIELTADGKREMRRIAVDRERQDVTLELGYVPESVRIDPDLRVWRLLAQSERPPILRQWIVARSPCLLVVSVDTSAKVAAEALARAFFESAPRAIEAGAMTNAKDPALIAGLHADVDAMLRSLGETRPAAIANKGSAQVWTIAATDKHPSLAVISARDVDALKALARPLPHYGSQSYLAFDGAQMIARGVWPAHAPVITVRR